MLKIFADLDLNESELEFYTLIEGIKSDLHKEVDVLKEQIHTKKARLKVLQDSLFKKASNTSAPENVRLAILRILDDPKLWLEHMCDESEKIRREACINQDPHSPAHENCDPVEREMFSAF